LLQAYIAGITEDLAPALNSNKSHTNIENIENSLTLEMVV